jgi:hypothetical protein
MRPKKSCSFGKGWNVALIPLSRGLFAVVDDADQPRLAGKSWHVADRRRQYAQTCWWDAPARRRRHALMHRFLMQAPIGVHVDHVNGDGLDNRRSNLRFATAHENAWNRSTRKKTTKGVFLYKGRFQARILWCGAELYLGQFDDEQAAAAVYDAAALRLFGRYARLNGIPDFRGLDTSLAGIRRLDGMRARAIYREVSQ